MKSTKKGRKQRINLILGCCIVFLLHTHFGFSQTIILKGSITDSINNPLSYANVVAEPIDEGDISFAISDERGAYQLKLVKDRMYSLKASYLGYKTKVISFKAVTDTVYNIVLRDRTEVLDVVTIDAKLAVSVKKDTITYQTDKFVTGEERKLRDVLKKLPGVEVDRRGNVTVQGKRVTKVLVENKPFFTGDSKLAVNNIPADAVNEIEVIDDYHDVALLKNLEDSDDMAMNIKLKEDKKKFWFGDVEVGAGIENRHLLHPSLFYYSPNTSVNLIGDFNNTGSKSFTFRDYLDFEGGYNNILLNPRAYFSRLNDDFSQFLNNQNFRASDHTFGGLNINQSLSANTDVLGYVMYSKSDNTLENQIINEYIGDATSLIERRQTLNTPTNTFVIGKVAVENNHDDGGKFRIQSFIKTSENQGDINTTTSVNSTSNFIRTVTTSENIDVKQDVEWYKGLSKNHTLTALAHINYTKSSHLTNWISSDDVFQDAIPVVEEDVFNLFKDKETTSRNLSLLLKHYWIISDYTHLHTTGGIQSYSDTFLSNEFQRLSDGSENNFSSNDFGNDVDFHFDNLYVGSHLRFQKGKVTVKSGLFLHQYLRSVEQLSQVNELNKRYLLPEFLMNIDFKRTEKMNIRYNRKVRFPSILRLLGKFTLTNFNSIYLGETNLENESYHQASIYYSKFSLFRKLNYNINLSYRKTQEGIRNQTILSGIDYITQPVLLDNADEHISMSGRITKGYGKIFLTLKSGIAQTQYVQLTNGSTQNNTSSDTNLGFGLKTRFNQFPNLDVSVSRSLSNYTTPISTTSFENDDVELSIDYDFWDDWVAHLDYNYRRFNNKTVNNANQNDILNLSLAYRNIDSPWSFEVTANNLFDNQFLRSNSFNDFLIVDNKTFVLPRIIMFKIAYKL